MVGLVSRVCSGGTNYGAVDSPGDHNFGGTVDSVTGLKGVRPCRYIQLSYTYSISIV